MNWLPGHARAYTVWIFLVGAVVIWFASHSGIKELGWLLLVTGFFLADQSVHLAQENHQDMRVTWLETAMQKHPLPITLFGSTLLLTGTILLIRA